MNRLVACVAVENTFFKLDGDYDYYVAEKDENKIKIGMTVKVPFGNANRQRKGVVVRLFTAINSQLKEISRICDDLPVLNEELVALALWLKERCFCTTYDCLRLMLPRGCGIVGDKSSKMAEILVSRDDELPVKLTPKQKSVVDLLFDIGTASVDEICEFCSVGKTVLNNLERYGVIGYFNKQVYRTPYEYGKNISPAERREIILSDCQQKAYNTFSSMLGCGGTGLLYGVTGSGKTQVYLRLIDNAVDSGRGVLVLFPEIGLTAQAMSIFLERYAGRVAVIHSGLSLGERNDEYRRIDRGEATVVIGTRSAVFAPVHNLGLIIMDEEQESCFKSERTPRYSAKDAANFRARYNKALFLMASATPSVECYSNAIAGKYALCELNERYGDAGLPEVITVDMKTQLKKNNASPVSPQLREMIQTAIDNGEQVILLINRRGYNTFIACCDCGNVITCPNCSISLTYHSRSNKLVCHYCGYTKRLDNRCSQCGSDNVRYSGYGTQRIEDELQALFPDAGILRMDADTTSSKFSHDKILEDFRKHKYDILVGTQMVAKGFDFPDVTLVGVVNADNALYDENYNSAERCFDLITQVVGRSGRHRHGGKAVIQTVNPYNSIIEYAALQDYKSFFKNEFQLRRALVYPPFCDIYSVSFTSEKENDALMCAKKFFELLRDLNKKNGEKLIILGPSPAKILKLNGRYRYRLTIKCKNSKNIRLLLTDILKKIFKIKEYKGVSVTVDLNPNDLN